MFILYKVDLIRASEDLFLWCCPASRKRHLNVLFKGCFTPSDCARAEKISENTHYKSELANR
jgi:hypothetical protein